MLPCKYLFLAIGLLTLACDEVLAPAGSDIVITEKALHDEQGYVELDFADLPYCGFSYSDADAYYEPMDADSIEMWEYRGQLYYHPLRLSRRARTFMLAFKRSGDQKYLARADKYIDFIYSRCNMIDSAAYLPCDFNYAVHGDSNNYLPAPWYSGMAQGELLWTLAKAYDITDDKEYLAFANLVFRSLVRLRPQSGVWVTRLDSLGYLWIEEYPHEEHPGMTLNGFNSALFGLYEYQRITKDHRARRLWDAALTTLKHYLPSFRRPGLRSYYCLGHRVVATEGYHDLHVQQMREIYRETGDSFFSDMADSLQADVTN